MRESIHRNSQGCDNANRCFDAGLQWCLTFEKELSIIRLEENTTCILHGGILWQNLTEGPETSGRGLSLTKNEIPGNGDDYGVIHPGIYTTLGELLRGKVDAQLSLEYTAENKYQQISRNISWERISQTPLNAFLKTVRRKILDGSMPDSKTVLLGRITSNSCVYEQKSLKYKAALAAARGVSLGDIPADQVNNYLVRELLDKKQYILSGSVAKLSLYNGLGEVVASKMITVCN